MQRMLDDFAIERPKAAAIADFRENDNCCGKLGDGVTCKRPFSRLTNQFDQDQADNKPDRGSDDLLDRIDPDKVTNAGTLADIEIERARDHVADGCGEKSGLGVGRDHEEENGNNDDALENDGDEQDRVFGAIEPQRVAPVLVTAEKAQRVLRPPGEKGNLQQFMRRSDERNNTQRMFIDDMGPDDHCDQLEQRSDNLRGQVKQGVPQQHGSGPQPSDQAWRGDRPDSQQGKNAAKSSHGKGDREIGG
jgi:hypothetical protein